jgi:hypothetical protein
MPLMAVMLALGLAELGWNGASGGPKAPVRWLFGILLGYSIFIQAVGAFCWPSTWNRGYPPVYERLWDWRRTEIATCLYEGPRIDPVGRRILTALGIEMPKHPADKEDMPSS